jgi:Hemerythrin HHE cation binding domain
MTDRENLFTPIHKGIRAMIYELGLRLGTTDFSKVAESNQTALQLKSDLNGSTANCVICLLYAHSRHEEQDFFSAVAPFDKEMVDLLMVAHRDINKRIIDISKTVDELVAATDLARRIEIGDRFCLEANDLFAAYLAHLNDEEATMVPVMWEHFTDAQLRAMRAQFYNRIPLPRFEDWMRWTLPALNSHELELLLRAFRSDPAPNRFADAMRVGEHLISPERWRPVKAHLA